MTQEGEPVPAEEYDRPVHDMDLDLGVGVGDGGYGEFMVPHYTYHVNEPSEQVLCKMTFIQIRGCVPRR